MADAMGNVNPTPRDGDEAGTELRLLLLLRPVLVGSVTILTLLDLGDGLLLETETDDDFPFRFRLDPSMPRLDVELDLFFPTHTTIAAPTSAPRAPTACACAINTISSDRTTPIPLDANILLQIVHFSLLDLNLVLIFLAQGMGILLISSSTFHCEGLNASIDDTLANICLCQLCR